MKLITLMGSCVLTGAISFTALTALNNTVTSAVLPDRGTQFLIDNNWNAQPVMWWFIEVFIVAPGVFGIVVVTNIGVVFLTSLK